MSMHLVHPSLNTTGKKKGKKKFRNSAAADKTRQAKEEWQDLLKRHGIEQTAKKQRRAMPSPAYKPPPLQYRGSEQPRIPSLPFTGGACAKGQDKVYTGDKCIGVTVVHKSCLQPVFNKQEAMDAAKMRR